MAITPRPQPYRLDPAIDQTENTANTDLMLQILFEDLKRVADSVPAVSTTVAAAGATGAIGPAGSPGMDADEPEFMLFGLPSPPAAVVQTTTATGTQNDFALTTACVLLRCNNATLLTLTGWISGRDGQLLMVESIGAGQVDFSHQAAGSVAANRLINPVTGIVTSLAAGTGRATFVYDGASARWRLRTHEQGAPIAYTVVWTGAATNPAIGNGTLSGTYVLRGTQLLSVIQTIMGTTTTFGTGLWQFSTKAAPAGTALAAVFNALLLDVSVPTNFPCAASYSAAGSGGLFAIQCSTNTNVDNTTVPWAVSDEIRLTAEFYIA